MAAARLHPAKRGTHGSMLRYFTTLASLVAWGHRDRGGTAVSYLLLIGLIAVVMMIAALVGIRLYD